MLTLAPVPGLSQPPVAVPVIYKTGTPETVLAFRSTIIFMEPGVPINLKFLSPSLAFTNAGSTVVKYGKLYDVGLQSGWAKKRKLSLTKLGVAVKTPGLT